MTADLRRMVCFESALVGAEHISHATLDGERTLCGRKDWAAEDPWNKHGPDCLRCAAILKKRESADMSSTLVALLTQSRAFVVRAALRSKPHEQDADDANALLPRIDAALEAYPNPAFALSADGRRVDRIASTRKADDAPADRGISDEFSDHGAPRDRI